MSIENLPLVSTPLAVVDLETTGLSPQHDAIVEIAIARIDDPTQPPRIVLDTLVDPQRRVTASEIHGIYDDDVVGAPLFGDLVRPIAEALDGAVMASFNVYFDMRFLEVEFARRKLPLPMPHLCLMWMRPALRLGNRGTLEVTCEAFGITHDKQHRAATDVLVSAQLWSRYLDAAQKLGVQTFGELAELKAYKYVKSWTAAPYQGVALSLPACGTALKPRRARSSDEQQRARRHELTAQQQLSRYWDALRDALTDGEITRDEIASLKALQQQPLMTDDAIRWAHAHIFSGLLSEMSRDLRIDKAEVEWLSHVSALLRELGWCPGDSPRAAAAAALPDPPANPLRDVPAPRFEALTENRSWWRSLFG